MAKLPKLPVPSFLARMITKRKRGTERRLRKPRIVLPTKQRKGKCRRALPGCPISPKPAKKGVNDEVSYCRDGLGGAYRE